MSDFLMPTLGADMEKGTLVTWLKKPGDTVHRGDLIAEVETDKGVIEIESFEDGVVDQLIVPEGTEAKVGEKLAVIRGDGEAPAPAPTAPERPKAAPKPAKPAAAKPEEGRPKPASPPPPPPKPRQEAATVPEGRKRVSPAARRKAQELGVDLAGITGTGPDGVVTLTDVEQATAKPTPEAAPAAKEAPAAAERPAKAPGLDLDAMRHAIAATMARAKRDIPHYYVSTTVDMEAGLTWLETYNKEKPPADRLLALVLVMKAAALALKHVPNLNGQYGETGLEKSGHVHMGTAIALRGGGLVNPAIFDLDKLSLPDVMAQLKDLSGRVRQGRMRRTELTEGTFTVTSLGEGGVETMTPIISPPQVGILAMGSIVERPWVVDGKVVSRRLVHLTLAGDHRASDGRHGAHFLEIVTSLLQEPEKL